MKTFRGVFTKNKLTQEEALEIKQYTFNINDEIEVNELIYYAEYKKCIQVTFVYGHTYQYVNVKTGDLSITESDYPYVKIKIISKHENKTESIPEEPN